MKTYLCMLGRDPKLSLLELIAYCNRKNIEYTLLNQTKLLAHITTNKPINVEELGGIIKIAEPTSIKQLIPSSNKITFSLTLIDSKNILDELRAFWKEQNVKALQKFAQMRDIPPSKAKNLDFDLIVFRNILYKVTSISNPKEYRERDEKRPSFDPKKVISIRLAKILINLSEAKNEITDPFCGTGTILQEALLMGYRVIGIDLFIDDARKNIEWLGKNYRNKTKFLQGDVTKVLSQMQSVEAIVTEPYMGPYYKKLPSEQEAQRTIKELIPLYTNFFTALHPKIKGKVVILLPRIRTYMKTFTLPINEILQKTGFEIVSPLPSIKLPLEYEKRHSKIERSIYILEAKRKA